MIASLLVILITIVCFERFKDRFELKNHFYYALGVRLIASVAFGSLYLYYYKGGDTLSYFNDAGIALDVLVTKPLEGLKFVFLGETGDAEFVYLNQPRALFFVRLLTPFTLLTGKSFWGLTLLISTVVFWVSWFLAERITKRNGVSSLVVSVGLLYVPEVIFWSSGILKESFSLSLQFGLLLCVLCFDTKKGLAILLFVLQAALLFKLKFYVAGVYLPILISYAIAKRLSVNPYLSFSMSFVFLLAGASLVHPHLSFESILDQLYLNMQRTISISDSSKALYLPFDGGIIGLVKSLPYAFLSLFRPFLWEAKGVLLLLLSLLRLDLLIGIILALYWVKSLNFDAIVVLFYSVIMLTLLAIASPNYGTLSRYSVAFTPFLLMVILVPIVSFFENRRE